MHTANDIVGLSLNSPALLEANARLAAAAIATVAGPFRGESPLDFVRSDANGDQLVDASDAIYTLGYLFVGGPEPSCRKSSDTDNNGILEVTDAIRLLTYLFLAGPAPESPFPDCGTDPTPDGLTCESYPGCD